MPEDFSASCRRFEIEAQSKKAVERAAKRIGPQVEAKRNCKEWKSKKGSHMPSRIARTGHAVISSEDVEGVSVHDANGKKVGKVDHLMIEKVSGHVTHVVISGQGFLGLGHNHYRLPWNVLKYSTHRNAFEIDVTEAQLK